MPGGSGTAPAWRMEQGGPQGTHIPSATPHLITTRLPFTSTLSRVSLLERDMFAAGRNHSNPAQPAPLRCLRALPQRRPRRHHPARLAPPLPSAIGSCCPFLHFYWSEHLSISGHPASRGRGLRRRLRSRPSRSRRSLRALGVRGVLCLSTELTVPHLI